jgi:polyisoprenyl-teichoic acid--peptidoglycan teichoic acid transferase
VGDVGNEEGSGSVRLVRPTSRTWPQRLLLSLNIFIVFACLLAAGSLAWAYNQASALPRIDVGSSLQAASAPGEAMNILLVGIDDGMGLAEGDPVLRGRSKSLNTDTIMILRVEPKTQQASLLSLPRDLWVDIAGGGQGRINTALSLGGPERLIQTINQDFGIPINHYAMVDFQGFEALVKAVNGVPVYFNFPSRDQATGLFQYDTGCQTLNGEQALAFARSRHFEISRDNMKTWQEDPTSDFGRVTRQQQFIRAALKKAVAQGVRNPFILKDFLDIAKKNVTLDTEFTVQQLVDLGAQFRTFDPEALVSFTPVATGTFKGAASVLELNVAASQPIFDVFRGLRPIPSPNVVPDLSGLTTSTTASSPSSSSGVTASTFGTTTTTQAVTTTTLGEFIPRVPDGQTCG